MRKLTLLFYLLFLVSFANSQTKLIGRVLNEKSNVPVASATICLNNKLYTTTDKKGGFQFKEIKNDSIHIMITHIGFKKFKKSYKINKQNKKYYLPIIKLKTDSIEIGEIKIRGKGVLEVIKGDTTEYNVGYLKMDKYDTAKELVEALPGVYRNEDGELIARGKKVKIVTIDGKNLYKDQVDANLKAMPADLIAKVQIYDDYSELSKFCGFVLDEFSFSSINLVTKYPNLKLAMGNYYAMGGNSSRYKLKGNNTFLLKNSNLNITEFLSNLPREYNGVGATVYPKKYKIKGLKTAYANQTKKIQLYIDGDFISRDKIKETTSKNKYLNEDRVGSIHSNSVSHSTNGFLNTYLDISINKRNKIYFENKYDETQSDIVYNKNYKQELNSQELVNSNYRVTSALTTKKLHNELISRSLLNPRTYLQVEIQSTYKSSTDKSTNKGLVNNHNLNEEQYIKELNRDLLFNPKIIYRKNQDNIKTFEHIVGYKQSEYMSNNQKFKLNYLINSLSYKSSIKTDLVDVNYKLGYRNVKSIDSGVKVHYNTIIGDIGAKFKFNKYNMSIDYSRTSQTPNILQLNDIYDTKNIFNYKIGNKDLKQAELNSFNLHLNKSNSRYLNCNLHYSTVRNYIVTNSYIVENEQYNGKFYKNGTIIRRNENINGYYSAGVKFNFNLPIMLFPSYMYSYIPNFYNGQKNYAHVNNFSLNIIWRYFRNRNYSVNINNSSSYSFVTNSINNLYSKNFVSNSKIGFTLRNFLGKSTLKLIYNTTINYYKLYTEDVDIRHYLSAEFRVPLVKSKFDLSFIARDIFNNAKTTYNSLNKDYLSKVETNLMSRLFLMKLSYKFRNVLVNSSQNKAMLKHRGKNQLKF